MLCARKESLRRELTTHDRQTLQQAGRRETSSRTLTSRHQSREEKWREERKIDWVESELVHPTHSTLELCCILLHTYCIFTIHSFTLSCCSPSSHCTSTTSTLFNLNGNNEISDFRSSTLASSNSSRAHNVQWSSIKISVERARASRKSRAGVTSQSDSSNWSALDNIFAITYRSFTRRAKLSAASGKKGSQVQLCLVSLPLAG